MYTGLLHTHRLVVTLFLLIYLVKFILLIVNKEKLASWPKWARISEMVISFLFLLTGIGMLVMGAQTTPMVWVKIGIVLASIPLAVIGYKRENIALAGLSLLFLVGAYGIGEMNKAAKAKPQELADVAPAELVTDPADANYDIVAHGKVLFKQYNCISCHGEDGALGLSGAKKLSESVATDAEIAELLANGKNAMPPYPGLTEDEVKALTAYVKSFRP
ncbi:SirB2 family protein [Pontibacter sp. G13]|uniref:SirB2 family protein n=1 Tax=Pontibacter sp. G13 TaxID=3074898 RepID=UPI00288A458B|nr:SirB2 family protein [Pontibacter sp. G13]WNJ16627.1 SirB2 family protein [Pontibacter sp. G13]